MNIYFSSAGRNGTLLLNFPIDTRGLIHENDVKASKDFADAVKETFAVNLAEKAKVTSSNIRGNSKDFGPEKVIDGNNDTYWATDDGMASASLTIDFMEPTTFNRFLVQEYIRLGQRVKAFTVEALVEGTWKEVAKASTIGYKRILRFPGVKATGVRFIITDSKSSPVISNLGIYNAPLLLSTPAVVRNKSGEISITPVDAESVVYYTLDGSTPTAKSKKYEGPFQTEGKIQLQAIAIDPSSGKSSPVSQEKYDISRKDWKIIGIENETANRVLDGNPSTAWHQGRDRKLPVELIIDLGLGQNLCGFRYLPDQVRTTGFILNYQFYVSNDNSIWKLVAEGEFSNIKNNPSMQVSLFKAVKARYIKLVALKNTSGNDDIGYAEIDVITQ
jgi:alpha-L-fucosidase